MTRSDSGCSRIQSAPAAPSEQRKHQADEYDCSRTHSEGVPARGPYQDAARTRATRRAAA